MADETSDQPVVDAPIAGADTGVVTEAPATQDDDIDTDAFDRMEAPEGDAEPAGDGEGGDAEPDKPAAAEAEDIEIEVGGQKLKVPKAIEPLLLMQADYTKKTQDLAEQRRQIDATASTLETERAQQAESLKAFRTEHMTVAGQEASLADIETRLAAYRQYSPAAWEATRVENPALYNQHRDALEHLRLMRTTVSEALDAAKTDLKTKEADLTKRQQEAHQGNLAKAWEATSAALAKEIPEWTPPWQPGKGEAIAKFAVEQLGYKPEELREATDPRAWKMAHELMNARAEIAKLKATQKQATATQTALKSQASTPAAPVKGNAQPRGLADGLSTEEWMRRRNAQVAKQRA